MELRSLPMVRGVATMMGLGVAVLAGDDPLGTLVRVSQLATPKLLLLHSRNDEIVPLDQAQRCFAASPLVEPDKRLCVFDRSGHNDLLLVHRVAVQALLASFFAVKAVPGSPHTLDLPALSVRELKALCAARGINCSHCVEKGDIVALLRA